MEGDNIIERHQNSLLLFNASMFQGIFPSHHIFLEGVIFQTEVKFNHWPHHQGHQPKKDFQASPCHSALV